MTVQQTKCWKCQGAGMKLKRKHAVPSHQTFHLIKVQDETKKNSLVQVECTECVGTGFTLKHTIKIPSRRIKRGFICPFKPPLHWSPKGPPPHLTIHEAAHLLQPGEMITSLCGDWSIFQLTTGHRYTTDDLSTAAVALKHLRQHSIQPKRHVDIGCGLGSVLFFIAYGFYDHLDFSLGLEAQSIHVELAKKTAWVNLGLNKEDGERLRIMQADLRDISVASSSLCTKLQPVYQSFDLVTGTPPYFPQHTGVLPTEQGRGMCSFEIRGGIETYCQAAAYLLSKHPQSRFVCCQTGLEISRSEKALDQVGMMILERWDFYGKVGKSQPLFVAFIATWKQEPIPSCSIVPVAVRDEHGVYTHEYRDILATVDKPPIPIA